MVGNAKIAPQGALKDAMGGVSCSCIKMRLVRPSSQVCKAISRAWKQGWPTSNETSTANLKADLRFSHGTYDIRTYERSD